MGKRILFVEDDAEFRVVFTHAIREALADEGLEIAFVVAGTLLQARSRLREGGLDAALIDVSMPDGDGLDLSRRRDPRRWRGQPDPYARVDGEPGRLRGRPCDGGGHEAGALQGGFDAGGRGSDQEVDQRRTLGGMSHLTDEWRSVSCCAVGGGTTRLQEALLRRTPLQ